ncbi:MAG: LamG domain-containing protein [Paludibacter sp.]|nr:LamG domain-containing protein [Paludibacter sp.]
MKKQIFKNAFIAFVILALFANVFTSCKTEEVLPVDKTVITALLSEYQAIANAASTLDYSQAAITSFKATLATAVTALENKKITQVAVDNLVVQLKEAKILFFAAAYQAIPANALLMGMSFDETVTANQFTTAGKPWTANLMKGPSEVFGTATNFPSFVPGKVGNAIYLSNGSNLQINNYVAADLLGKQLSFAVWVKPDSTRAGNYIISYNYWNSWKFQLQSENKPFFTVHTNADGWVDADNEAVNSAPNKAWTHLVVTLNMDTKKLTFYVNGALTKEWTATTKTGLTGTGAFAYPKTLPLIIGAATTYAEANAEWGWWTNRNPQGWDSFIGALDELKIYNTSLSAGQVNKLYRDENK